MRYVCDPWVWLCFGMGLIYPIAAVAMHQHLGLNHPTEKRWTTKRIIFVFTVLAALFGATYITHGYLTLERHEISFSIGIFLGGIFVAWRFLNTQFGLHNPLKPMEWKLSFSKALAAEGKSIDDLKNELARTIVQMLFAMIAVLLLLLIIRSHRLFGE